MSIIILREGQDDEYKIELQQHVGKDRNKDAKIMAFISKFESIGSEGAIMEYIATREDFLDIADMALDLDDKWNKDAPMLTWGETFRYFMDAIEFRTSALQRKDVEEALKK